MTRHCHCRPLCSLLKIDEDLDEVALMADLPTLDLEVKVMHEGASGGVATCPYSTHGTCRAQDHKKKWDNAKACATAALAVAVPSCAIRSGGHACVEGYCRRWPQTFFTQLRVGSHQQHRVLLPPHQLLCPGATPPASQGSYSDGPAVMSRGAAITASGVEGATAPGATPLEGQEWLSVSRLIILIACWAVHRGRTRMHERGTAGSQGGGKHLCCGRRNSDGRGI
eukprot:351012-Chlamydomonas_euryale.AAC.5